MATKPRYLKTPLQLWIADNRKRLELTPKDLAELTGVTVDTARGWESRGKPSEDALVILERRFGVPRPPELATPAVGQEALIAAMAAQTQAISDLVAAIRDLVDRPTTLSALNERRTALELDLREFVEKATGEARGAAAELAQELQRPADTGSRARRSSRSVTTGSR